MDAITEQAKFLHRHGIDSEEQLSAFRTDTEKRLAVLIAVRKALSNENRRASVPEERKLWLGVQISVLSQQIKSLRPDIKLCDDILKRALIIAEKQTQLTIQEQGNKKQKAIDRIKPYR